MPFSAYHRDEYVCSLDYSSDEWISLKSDKREKSHTKCPICDSQLIYVTGDYDTFFYRHPAGVKCPYVEKYNHKGSGGESKEHISLKKAIYNSCKRWNIPAKLEVYKKGIISDVLIECQDKKIALEIQLSKITLFKLLDRNSKYFNVLSDTIPVWLLKEFPKRRFSQYGLGKRLTLYNRFLCHAMEFNPHPDTGVWGVWTTKNKFTDVDAFLFDIVQSHDFNYFNRAYHTASNAGYGTLMFQNEIMQRMKRFHCDSNELLWFRRELDEHFREWPDTYDGEFPSCYQWVMLNSDLLLGAV